MKKKNPFIDGRSQIGQDHWVLEQTAEIKRPKTFLEIGACDGLAFSNTWLLEQKGDWTGLLVEPHNSLFLKLETNRPGCKVSNALIDSDCHEVWFWPRVGWISGIVDLDTDQGRARNLQELRAAKQRGQVKKRWTRMLVNVLEEHDMPRVIDYFSLDVEGAEHRILTRDVLERYRFNVLTIERPKSQLQTLLAEFGYIVVAKKSPLDTYYRHGEFPQHPET